MDTWGKHISGRGNCICEGPEAALCLSLSRSSKEASVCGMNEKKGVGDTLREVN